MSTIRHKRPRPSLLGSVGSALAAGLAMYRGWHS